MYLCNQRLQPKVEICKDMTNDSEKVLIYSNSTDKGESSSDTNETSPDLSNLKTNFIFVSPFDNVLNALLIERK